MLTAEIRQTEWVKLSVKPCVATVNLQYGASEMGCLDSYEIRIIPLLLFTLIASGPDTVANPKDLLFVSRSRAK
jgi:hypothetical protein